MTTDFVTMAPVIEEARKHLDQGAWDFLIGGSESETTLRRNRAAFDRLAFRPRVLVDVSDIDPSTTFMGHPLRIPILTAPVGSLTRFTPQGAKASAAAAAEYGVISVHSSVGGSTIEEIAAVTDSPRMYQLYIRGDMDWVRDNIQRIRDNGYAGFVLTVDTAVGSRRERPLISEGAPTVARGNVVDRSWASSVTWKTMEQIREMTAGMPFMLKGVQTAEDATIAVEHGVDVIWVSNHGGRQIDHGLGTMETLPEIAAAVGGRATIVLDGSVHRGSDVLKAIALGADAVAVGRLQGWGLAAAGKDGLLNVFRILEAEMRSTMGLLGVTRLDQLSPKHLVKADLVTIPHEMSTWPNIPGGRIQ